jgi:hypothetical protein
LLQQLLCLAVSRAAWIAESKSTTSTPMMAIADEKFDPGESWCDELRS